MNLAEIQVLLSILFAGLPEAVSWGNYSPTSAHKRASIAEEGRPGVGRAKLLLSRDFNEAFRLGGSLALPE